MEQWAVGAFDEAANTRALGQIEQLDKLIGLDAEQLEEGIHEE